MNKLDKYDLAILQELQADARLTNARAGPARGPVGRALLAARAGARFGRGRGFIRATAPKSTATKIGLGVLALCGWMPTAAPAT